MVAAIVVAMVAALAAGAPGAAQADRISDARAQANREWARAQSEGRRLEVVVERYDGARVRLDETLRSIGVNEVRLASARRNLIAGRHALSVSLISAYKHPMPDPLQSALEARNFGQVLEQFALLDRTNQYNSTVLTEIRAYRAEVDKRQRALNRERNARRVTVSELRALKGHIAASVAAAKQRYRGLRSEVRRLIEERRQAELAAYDGYHGRDRAGLGRRFLLDVLPERPVRDVALRRVGCLQVADRLLGAILVEHFTCDVL